MKILLLSLLIINSCDESSKYDDKDYDSNPEWVDNILSEPGNSYSTSGSSSSNSNLLSDSWVYSSVLSYDNSDCTGNSEQTHEFEARIEYAQEEGVREYSKTFSLSDYDRKDEEITASEFQDLCIEKEGTFNDDATCTILIQDKFKYYLNDYGYCEEYNYDDKKDDYDDKKDDYHHRKDSYDGKKDYYNKYKELYCGQIEFEDDNLVKISFTWDSQKREKSGCKVIALLRD